jgi:hypothetical protein
MSGGQYTTLALTALADRGIKEPSQELLRLEVTCIHLEEACLFAGLAEQPELERQIASVIVRVRDQRQIVETCSVIV